MAIIKRKIIKTVVLTAVMALIIFIAWGVFDFWRWLSAKSVIAGGGYTTLCGARILQATPACTQTCLGKCCCALCDAYCTGTTQLIFSQMQPVCGGITYACASPTILVKGGGTTLIGSDNKQIMFGSFTGNLLTDNAAVATPAVAASAINKIVNWLDKFIITGRKDN